MPIKMNDSELLTEEKTETAVTVCADMAPPDVMTRPEVSPRQAVPNRRGQLFAMLVLTVFASLGVIVLGVTLTDAAREIAVPLSELLPREIFGTGIVRMSGSYSPPPLERIAPQTVTGGEKPGAAENETAPPKTAPASDGFLPICEVDLASDVPLELINATPYEPNFTDILSRPRCVPTLAETEEAFGAGAPLVLIIHTHGTESYAAEGADSYEPSCSFRTLSPDDSVVAVGRAMKEVLTSHGIGVIHLETMFDADDYNSAYPAAAEEIRRYLRAYPSICYVFDVHRDAMITEEGACLRPVTRTDAGPAAQIMLVVGTDAAGSGHTEWADNLAFAAKVQLAADNVTPGLMRSINLRCESFNEQYSKGSLLVEVGTAGNCLSEATRSARLFADAVSEVIIGGGK